MLVNEITSKYIVTQSATDNGKTAPKSVPATNTR